jgi:hypothetical protein
VGLCGEPGTVVHRVDPARVGQVQTEVRTLLADSSLAGIPLTAESRGLLRHIKTTDSSASVAFGHEVAVTTLQLAQAAAVVANGGLLVRPRLVLKKGGQTVPVPAPQRVLKPDTAITMRKMMEGVVVLPEGTDNAGDGVIVRTPFTSSHPVGSALGVPEMPPDVTPTRSAPVRLVPDSVASMASAPLRLAPVSVARVPLPGETLRVEDLPAYSASTLAAIDRFLTPPPEIVVHGCTAAGFLGGPEETGVVVRTRTGVP